MPVIVIGILYYIVIFYFFRRNELFRFRCDAYSPFAAKCVKYDFKYDKCYYNKHYRSNSAGSYCFPLSFSVRSASASIASLSE